MMDVLDLICGKPNMPFHTWMHGSCLPQRRIIGRAIGIISNMAQPESNATNSLFPGLVSGYLLYRLTSPACACVVGIGSKTDREDIIRQSSGIAAGRLKNGR